MKDFRIIAFTHKTVDLNSIGGLHLGDDNIKDRLVTLKNSSGLDELVYLNTCNRVEFLMVTGQKTDKKFLSGFFQAFNPAWQQAETDFAIKNAIVLEGENALKHLLNVASSLDSIVVGEREIITQVRNAFEKCREWGLAGDLIRLIVRQTVETAKRVYTETSIARNPVSVVSLAYRKLKDLNIKLDAQFVIVGSGITNTSLARYLKKHGFRNFALFNRTLANAMELAGELNAEAFPLSELINYSKGFDVLISCTASPEYVINKEIYSSLVGNDTGKKIIIDLAIPNDLDPEVTRNFNVGLISVNDLRETAEGNLVEREKELTKCEGIIERSITDFRQILKTRRVELAMSEIPRKVKEIHHTALEEVFAKELASLDQQSKEILNKILTYVEKKYISVPMKMAKDILIEKK